MPVVDVDGVVEPDGVIEAGSCEFPGGWDVGERCGAHEDPVGGEHQHGGVQHRVSGNGLAGP